MRGTWVAAFILLLSTSLCAGADSKAVLWQAPGKVTLQDWIWGPGGETRVPKPPFEFVAEDRNGTNPKIKVKDANGSHWTVKFGGEDHGDVFASRLLYALGYLSQPSYFVVSGVIAGAHNLRRAKAFVARDGTFHYARFKLTDHKTLAPVRGQTWSWNENPFLGTPQLNGLKILMMLASNWDAKDARDGEGSNTGVYFKPGSPSDQSYYAFDDWGATMGRWGGFFQRDKWNPAGYSEQTKDFAKAAGGKIEWGYRGKHGSDVSAGITVEDVRWLLTYLSPVTDEELRAGLRASGATEPEINLFARSIRNRIGQMQRLCAVADMPSTTVRPLLPLGSPVTGAPDFRKPGR